MKTMPTSNLNTWWATSVRQVLLVTGVSKYPFGSTTRSGV